MAKALDASRFDGFPTNHQPNDNGLSWMIV